MHNAIKQIATILSYLPFPKSRLSVETCREELDRFHKKPAGTCINKNNVAIEYDLQIIIPTYNAEKFIEDCLKSVMMQRTRYSYIVTVINDGSKDRTKEILERYQNSDHIECIHQENKGFSGARNRGLEILKGRYITFLDSDDMLAPDTIEHMLQMAYKTDADIVQGGWHEFGDGHDEYKMPGTNGLVEDISVCFSGYPWGKLYKYSVLEQFQFPEGFWFEDTPVSYILEALPLKFAALNKVVYEYRINPNGITQTAVFNKKSVDSYWITEQCLLDFPSYGLNYDQRAYDYFLRQVVVNYLRTRRMPYNIRRAIFLLTADCMKRFFENAYTSTDKKYARMEQVLKAKRYLQYEMIMIQFR